MNKPAAIAKFEDLLKRLALDRTLTRSSPARDAVIKALYALGHALDEDKFISRISVLEGSSPVTKDKLTPEEWDKVVAAINDQFNPDSRGRIPIWLNQIHETAEKKLGQKIRYEAGKMGTPVGHSFWLQANGLPGFTSGIDSDDNFFSIDVAAYEKARGIVDPRKDSKGGLPCVYAAIQRPFSPGMTTPRAIPAANFKTLEYAGIEATIKVRDGAMVYAKAFAVFAGEYMSMNEMEHFGFVSVTGEPGFWTLSLNPETFKVSKSGDVWNVQNKMRNEPAVSIPDSAAPSWLTRQDYKTTALGYEGQASFPEGAWEVLKALHKEKGTAFVLKPGQSLYASFGPVLPGKNTPKSIPASSFEIVESADPGTMGIKVKGIGALVDTIFACEPMSVVEVVSFRYIGPIEGKPGAWEEQVGTDAMIVIEAGDVWMVRHLTTKELLIIPDARAPAWIGRQELPREKLGEGKTVRKGRVDMPKGTWDTLKKIHQDTNLRDEADDEQRIELTIGCYGALSPQVWWRVDGVTGTTIGEFPQSALSKVHSIQVSEVIKRSLAAGLTYPAKHDKPSVTFNISTFTFKQLIEFTKEKGVFHAPDWTPPDTADKPATKPPAVVQPPPIDSTIPDTLDSQIKDFFDSLYGPNATINLDSEKSKKDVFRIWRTLNIQLQEIDPNGDSKAQMRMDVIETRMGFDVLNAVKDRPAMELDSLNQPFVHDARKIRSDVEQRLRSGEYNELMVTYPNGKVYTYNPQRPGALDKIDWPKVKHVALSRMQGPPGRRELLDGVTVFEDPRGASINWAPENCTARIYVSKNGSSLTARKGDSRYTVKLIDIPEKVLSRLSRTAEVGGYESVPPAVWTWFEQQGGPKLLKSIKIPTWADSEVQIQSENTETLDPNDDTEVALNYFLGHCKDGRLNVLENTDLRKLLSGINALANIADDYVESKSSDGETRKQYRAVRSGLEKLGEQVVALTKRP